MKFGVLIVVLFSVASLNASLSSEYAYSKACSAGACGDWESAQRAMSMLMVDNPDNPELLYDNGVAAHKLKEYEKASVYFKAAAKSARSGSLKVQSLFNAGNAAFGLQNYDDAIAQYESVLRLDPGNVPAKHNLEVVKKIRQEEKNKQHEQNGDDNKDEQDKQSDQKNGDGDQQQQKNGQGKQGGDQGEKKHDRDGDQQKGDDGHDSGSQQKQKQQDAQGDKDGDEKSETDNRSGQKKGSEGEQDDKDNHENPQDMQGKSKSNDTKDGKKEQMQSGKSEQSAADRREKENQQFAQQFAPNERWMMNALARREKSDEQTQKQMTKKEIDKKLPGNHGKNNW